MVRSFTPSDDEEEIRTKRKHQRRQSNSRSPKRESRHGKKKKKSRFEESRSVSTSPPPKRKIKIEPESTEYEQGERTHSRKHHKEVKHREDRDRRKQEHKNRKEERLDPHRRIKQEPDEDARGQRRDDERMRGQRRERERNDDRRREARSSRQRGNNPFRTEDDGFEYGQQQEQAQGEAEAEEPKDKDKPDFKLSGKLTEDTNTYRGVVIKYNQPPEARKPKKRWRLYPFKGDEDLPVLHVHRMSAYLIGRDRLVVDIPTDHPSCSKQHAVLQYRLVNFEREDGTKGRKVAPYVIDLDSSNGTYVNNQRIDSQRYVELLEKDLLKFGFSSREYVLLHEKTDTSELAEESGSGSDD